MTLKSSDIATPGSEPAHPIVKTTESWFREDGQGKPIKIEKHSGEPGMSKREAIAAQILAGLAARTFFMTPCELQALSQAPGAQGKSLETVLANTAAHQADTLLRRLNEPANNYDALQIKIEELRGELTLYKRLMPVVRDNEDGGGIQFGNCFYSFDAITGYDGEPGMPRDAFYLNRITANKLIQWANQVKALADLGKPGPGMTPTGNTTQLGN